jgi:hypothetical protein
VTKSEIAQLLALAAAVDRRTVGRADIEAWHLILRMIPFQTACEALAAHYAETERWVMPSDIARRVNQPGELPYYRPAAITRPVPDQPVVNARGKQLCRQILASRPKGPLTEGMTQAVEQASEMSS